MILISTNKSMERLVERTKQWNKGKVTTMLCFLLSFSHSLGKNVLWSSTKALRESELFLDIMSQQPHRVMSCQDKQTLLNHTGSCHVRTNTYKSHSVMSGQTPMNHTVMSWQTPINHTGSCHVRTNTYKSHRVMSGQTPINHTGSCQDKQTLT